MKSEVTKWRPQTAAANVLQQQARFDTFIDCYNQERPHQALGMQVRTPGHRASIAASSTRPIRCTMAVPHCGRICFRRHKAKAFGGLLLWLDRDKER